MYMLAVYYVRSTNMSQINVCQQLFRAVHSQAKLMFVTTLEMDNLDRTK